jgi:hypothetical protein
MKITGFIEQKLRWRSKYRHRLGMYRYVLRVWYEERAGFHCKMYSRKMPHGHGHPQSEVTASEYRYIPRAISLIRDLEAREP